jgi:3-oxoacyl-[acyl-carrier protein] reductase
MELGLEGRAAIVTGASKGIGRAVADQLGSHGASVVLSARDGGALDEAVAELQGHGYEAIGVPADVVDRSSSTRLREAALEAFGRIDIVVNNAGGGGGTLGDFDEDEWHHIYALNVLSAMRLTMACLPDMQSRGWGRVVNVASTMARHCDPRFGPYGAAKAALLHVSRNLSLAYAGDGILTNCVLPGLTRTEGVRSGLDAQASQRDTTADDIERRMMRRQPIAMGRLGEPEEVAAAIVFLCSEQARWITGADLLVDGGTITDIP